MKSFSLWRWLTAKPLPEGEDQRWNSSTIFPAQSSILANVLRRLERAVRLSTGGAIVYLLAMIDIPTLDYSFRYVAPFVYWVVATLTPPFVGTIPLLMFAGMFCIVIVCCMVSVLIAFMTLGNPTGKVLTVVFYALFLAWGLGLNVGKKKELTVIGSYILTYVTPLVALIALPYAVGGVTIPIPPAVLQQLATAVQNPSPKLQQILIHSLAQSFRMDPVSLAENVHKFLSDPVVINLIIKKANADLHAHYSYFPLLQPLDPSDSLHQLMKIVLASLDRDKVVNICFTLERAKNLGNLSWIKQAPVQVHGSLNTGLFITVETGLWLLRAVWNAHGRIGFLPNVLAFAALGFAIWVLVMIIPPVHRQRDVVRKDLADCTVNINRCLRATREVLHCLEGAGRSNSRSVISSRLSSRSPQRDPSGSQVELRGSHGTGGGELQRGNSAGREKTHALSPNRGRSLRPHNAFNEGSFTGGKAATGLDASLRTNGEKVPASNSSYIKAYSYSSAKFLDAVLPLRRSVVQVTDDEKRVFLSGLEPYLLSAGPFVFVVKELEDVRSRMLQCAAYVQQLCRVLFDVVRTSVVSVDFEIWSETVSRIGSFIEVAEETYKTCGELIMMQPPRLSRVRHWQQVQGRLNYLNELERQLVYMHGQVSQLASEATEKVFKNIGASSSEPEHAAKGATLAIPSGAHAKANTVIRLQVQNAPDFGASPSISSMTEQDKEGGEIDDTSPTREHCVNVEETREIPLLSEDAGDDVIPAIQPNTYKCSENSKDSKNVDDKSLLLRAAGEGVRVTSLGGAGGIACDPRQIISRVRHSPVFWVSTTDPQRKDSNCGRRSHVDKDARVVQVRAGASRSHRVHSTVKTFRLTGDARRSSLPHRTSARSLSLPRVQQSARNVMNPSDSFESLDQKEARNVCKTMDHMPLSMALIAQYHAAYKEPLALAKAVKALQAAQRKPTWKGLGMNCLFPLLPMVVHAARLTVTPVKQILFWKLKWRGYDAWWRDPAAWYLVKFFVPMVTLFSFAVFFKEFSQYSWGQRISYYPSVMDSCTQGITTRTVPWIMLGFLTCLQTTYHGTVFRAVNRAIGITCGSFAAWLVLYACDFGIGKIICFSCCLLGLDVFLMADCKNPNYGFHAIWGYAAVVFTYTQALLVGLGFERLGGLTGARDYLTVTRIVSSFLGIVIAVVVAHLPPACSGNNAASTRYAQALDCCSAAVEKAVYYMMESSERFVSEDVREKKRFSDNTSNTRVSDELDQGSKEDGELVVGKLSADTSNAAATAAATLNPAAEDDPSRMTPSDGSGNVKSKSKIDALTREGIRSGKVNPFIVGVAPRISTADVHLEEALMAVQDEAAEKLQAGQQFYKEGCSQMPYSPWRTSPVLDDVYLILGSMRKRVEDMCQVLRGFMTGGAMIEDGLSSLDVNDATHFDNKVSVPPSTLDEAGFQKRKDGGKWSCEQAAARKGSVYVLEEGNAAAIMELFKTRSGARLREQICAVVCALGELSAAVAKELKGLLPTTVDRLMRYISYSGSSSEVYSTFPDVVHEQCRSKVETAFSHLTITLSNCLVEHRILFEHSVARRRAAAFTVMVLMYYLDMHKRALDCIHESLVARGDLSVQDGCLGSCLRPNVEGLGVD